MGFVFCPHRDSWRVRVHVGGEFREMTSRDVYSVHSGRLRPDRGSPGSICAGFLSLTGSPGHRITGTETDRKTPISNRDLRKRVFFALVLTLLRRERPDFVVSVLHFLTLSTSIL